jgi:hypothetical protein
MEEKYRIGFSHAVRKNPLSFQPADGRFNIIRMRQNSYFF